MKHLAAALLLSFVALTAAAQTGSPAAASSQPPARQPIPATPGATFDLAWIGKIVRLTDPQISPSGKSVALVATRPDYEHDLNPSAHPQPQIGRLPALVALRRNARLPRR